MKGLNKVQLIGNLGNDPEVRHTKAGVTVTSFNVATSETWTDEDGDKQESVEWHRLVAWDKLGEVCGEYLFKGSRVYIEGKLKTRTWEDEDEIERYSTEIVCSNLIMLGDPQDKKEKSKSNKKNTKKNNKKGR